MRRYFFKKETLNSYQKDMISQIVRSLILKLEVHPKNFSVTPINSGEYQQYQISVHGVHQYNIIHKPFYIKLNYVFDGYNGSDIDNDDVMCTTDIFGIKVVTVRGDINDHVDMFIKNMVNKALYGYVTYITEDLKKERGKASIDVSNFGVNFGFGLTVDPKQVDSRFPIIYKAECEIHESEYIESDSSLENATEIIDGIVSRARNKINAAQIKYNNIKETVGGVTINLDGKDILCHKSFKPLITGGFITFKCPYTNSMVSMKSTKYDCVIVNGMDEVYGSNDSIVLIGNN